MLRNDKLRTVVPYIPSKNGYPDKDDILAMWAHQIERNQHNGRRRQAVAMYEDGFTLREIAERLGYANVNSVNSALTEMGVPRARLQKEVAA